MRRKNPFRQLSPTNDPRSFLDDYVFESRTYSSLTLNGRNNPATLQSPWNFDTNNGGFKSGLTNGSLASLNLTQWGEDRNLNGVLDTGEDRNANGTLDQNWNTLGGCGWQTSSAAGSPGGVWHTGRIDVTTLSTCLAAGTAAGRCRQNATVSGFFGQNVWWEVLTTPQVFKVHVCPTGSETDCVRNGVPEADRDMASPGFQGRCGRR